MIFSTAASAILFPFLQLKIMWFFVASIMIDIDHFFSYYLKHRNFSVRGMFEYHKNLFANRKENPFLDLSIFHTLEFLILILTISCYSEIALFIFWGLIFHVLLDVVYLYKYDFLFGRAWSLIEYFIRVRISK